MAILYHSTNNVTENICFRDALLKGIASGYGLYMMARSDIPGLDSSDINGMRSKSYAEIAFTILFPFVSPDIKEKDFLDILKDAYNESIIPVDLQNITGETYILWLSKGPTYSFKDFAARFFGRVLNHFLNESGLKRTVIVATSGDTGGAVADALHGLSNISNIVFFPKDAVSEPQRRQMTALKKNIHAFAVNGDFDVCQEIAKNLLSDKNFAAACFDDENRFTSANSISLGRLLPQAVYPFFAYSRMNTGGKPFIASIPSGNFGDMMGTVIAKEMGLPIEKIVCGVNENREYPEFLYTGKYRVQASTWSPSTAMIVSHPSNLTRLIEFYGGHMHDERNKATKRVTNAGIIDRMPDLKEMREDIYSVSISNEDHYKTIRQVYDTFGVILDPHGSVGWKSLEEYLEGRHTKPAVIYETADPGKFPEDIKKAIGATPPIPDGIGRQKSLEERIYNLCSQPYIEQTGSKRMSEEQYSEVKEIIKTISVE
ncbi:MAG: threonine synthase [Spirochaetes bacterium]|nr:threonine synthase [Spirochaetota bacterium]